MNYFSVSNFTTQVAEFLRLIESPDTSDVLVSFVPADKLVDLLRASGIAFSDIRHEKSHILVGLYEFAQTSEKQAAHSDVGIFEPVIVLEGINNL